MSLKSVFVDEKSGYDYVRLPNDFGSWQEEIIKRLYKRLPDATKHLVRIDFKKKDEEKGYAVGTAIVSRKDGNVSISVPVIIKQFKLAPLDVFIMNGAFFPLTDYSFKKYFGSKELFSGTIDRREYDMASPYSSYDLYTETHPPFHVKMGSAIAKILDSIEVTDIKNFKQSLLNNPDSFAKLASHKHTSQLLKDVCSRKPVKLEKRASMEDDIVCIEKFGFNKFKVLSNNSNCFNPKSEVWDYKMMKSAGITEDVLTEGAFYKFAKKNDATPYVEEDMTRSPLFIAKPAEDSGKYAMKTVDGTTYIGTYIPLVIDWNQKPTSSKLFISGENYAHQNKMAGIKRMDEYRLSEGKLTPGARGTFVYESGTKILATIPFDVVSLTTEPNKMTVMVRDDLGKLIQLIVTPMLEQITPHVGGKIPTYFIPWSMKFIHLGREVELVSNPATYENMTKMAAITDNYLQIIDNDGTYSFKGKGLDKYANVNGVRFDFTLVKPFEAKYVLMSFGCDQNEADYMLKAAAQYGSCKIHGLNMTNTIDESEHNDSEKIKKYDELFAHIKDMKSDLIKEASLVLHASDPEAMSAVFVNGEKEYNIYKIASELDNAMAVDNVLSLNFINPTNIKTFVNMKGDLELTASKLAQLLVASRLGCKNIPENETAVTMNNVLYVIEGLDLLEGKA